MTCICAVVHYDHSITFGADSASSSECSIMINLSRKIFRKNDLLFGVAGSLRSLQLLKYNLTIPARQERCTDEQYVAVQLINAIRTTLKEENHECKIIIGYRGAIYHLNEDWGFFISHSYDAIGASDDIAKGSLFATEQLSPIERIHLALSASVKHSAFVRPPFIFESLYLDPKDVVQQLLTVTRQNVDEFNYSSTKGEISNGRIPNAS